MTPGGLHAASRRFDPVCSQRGSHQAMGRLARILTAIPERPPVSASACS